MPTLNLQSNVENKKLITKQITQVIEGKKNYSENYSQYRKSVGNSGIFKWDKVLSTEGHLSQ